MKNEKKITLNQTRWNGKLEQELNGQIKPQ